MPTTSDRYSSHLDPHILDFLEALEAQGGPALWTLSPADSRNVLLSVQRSVDVPMMSADSSDRALRGGTTGEISLRIIRPHGVSGAIPGIMYFHGGGWILGDTETHDRLIREIATGAQASVVFVEYARAPEAKYPVAIEQAYTATTWVAEHGAAIAFQAHLYPVTDANFETPSYRAFGDKGYWLSRRNWPALLPSVMP